MDTGLSLGGLPLTLTYNSARHGTGPAGNGAAVNEPPSFGPLWFSNFHRRLDAHPFYQDAYRGGGDMESFPSSANVNDVLSGSVLLDMSAQASEVYDLNGNLSSRTLATGAVLTFSYSDATTPLTVAPAPGYLIKVADGFGRSIGFTYELPSGGVAATSGRINAIIDQANRTIGVHYDVAGNLSEIDWADGNSRKFVYEDSAHPWAMTGVIDERGIRFVTVGYDAAGNAVSTQLAGGVDKYTVSYLTPPTRVSTTTYDSVTHVYKTFHDWSAPVGTVVSAPGARQVNLGMNTVLGYPQVASRSQPAGSGCSASTSTTTFDSSGRPLSADDFNGGRRCFAYGDSRNLASVVAEGLTAATTCSSVTSSNTTAMPPGSRKLVNAWHPQWPLQVKEKTAKRVTAWTYNGQVDAITGTYATCAPITATYRINSQGGNQPIAVLCAKHVQASSDEDGSNPNGHDITPGVATRNWTWTYNEFGQVLTATDPLGSLTSYTYYSDTTADHTRGDLHTATDPTGASTAYTRYDSTGHVLQIVDPNNTTTDMSYTARGWVSSVTVTPQGGTAQQTLIGRNSVGQVTSLQSADGAQLGYAYDDAQRLHKITDAAGNTVTYTLDDAGNVLQEDLADASGTLKRRVTRAFDALNRLQSVTGARQ